MVLRGVDGADDFGDGGDVSLHEGERLLLERAHALRGREAAQLFLGGPADEQPADLGSDLQELVDADALAVAGARAEVAAAAVPELGLADAGALDEEGEVLGRRLV